MWPVYRWLFACASSQKIVPVEEFLISNSSVVSNDVVMKDVISDDEELSNFKTPLKSFQPKFDVNVSSNGWMLWVNGRILQDLSL